MSRIAFVQNLSFEYLGIMYLSSILKHNGHQTQVFIDRGRGRDGLIREIDSFNPELIGLSCTTGIHLWALDFARDLKAALPGVKIIFGGAHPTFFPDIIKEEQVDIICRGEGEFALLELLNKFDRREDYSTVANLWVKSDGNICKNDVRPLVTDLDALPFPDRELYSKKYPFLNKSQRAFITGRGCPFSCSYCFNHALKELYKGKGCFIRYRSVANVIDEMRQVKESGNFKIVYIQDDTFGLNRDFAFEFLKNYKKEIGMPFLCLVRADKIDEGLIKGLKVAGCLNIFFGVESGSQGLRNLILKKNITDEQINNAAGLLKKYKIGFRTYNMFGLPGETLKEALKTVELNIKIKTDYPWSSMLQPFPGTELGNLVYEQGLLKDGSANFQPSFFKASSIKLKDAKEIINLHKLFLYAVKFPFLLPAIKLLIKINLTPVYDFLFLAGYFYSYKKSEGISWGEAMSIGLNNVQNFFNTKWRLSQ